MIDRHKTSKKILKFYSEKNVEPELTMDDGLQSRIKPDAVIEKLIATNWPELSPKSPRHWSGIPTVLERAVHLGVDYERLYYEIYTVMNWHDHSSPASWIEMSFSKKHAGFQTAIICVMRIMTIILDTIKKEFRFDVVVQDFTQQLYKLWFGPMEVMVKELEKMRAEGKWSQPTPGF